MKTLNQLKPGEYGTITEFGLKEDMKRRLEDMGMIKGSRIQCVGSSPMGDPTAYLCRETVVALRKADAQKIMVEDGFRR